MEELIKKLTQLLELTKALKEPNKPLTPAIPALPAIKPPVQPSMTPPKVGQAKMPGVNPNSKKDPKKVAQQIKDGSMSTKTQKILLKFHENGQWSLEKSARVFNQKGSLAGISSVKLPKLSMKVNNAMEERHAQRTKEWEKGGVSQPNWANPSNENLTYDHERMEKEPPTGDYTYFKPESGVDIALKNGMTRDELARAYRAHHDHAINEVSKRTNIPVEKIHALFPHGWDTIHNDYNKYKKDGVHVHYSGVHNLDNWHAQMAEDIEERLKDRLLDPHHNTALQPNYFNAPKDIHEILNHHYGDNFWTPSNAQDQWHKLSNEDKLKHLNWHDNIKAQLRADKEDHGGSMSTKTQKVLLKFHENGQWSLEKEESELFDEISTKKPVLTPSPVNPKDPVLNHDKVAPKPPSKDYTERVKEHLKTKK